MIKHVLKTLVAVLAIAAAAAGPVRGQNSDVSWVLTPYGDLQNGDTVVIVDKTSERAMTNNNGSFSAPSAVEIGLSGDQNALSAAPAATLQWVVERDNGNYMFKVPGTSNYLYCTSDNDGVRVGVSSANQFTFQIGGTYDAPFLKNNATSRYLGLTNAYLWRCPSSISNSSIKDNVISFYKKTVVIIPTHTVRLAEGTEDAANWTVTPAEALTTGIMSGSQLTATYAGDLKVKEVIATKHLEPNEVPLTIEALTAGTIVVQQPQSGMQYTLNGGAKTAMTGAQTVITVAVGDKVAFYGNGTSITSYFGTAIAGTADVKAYGNIMSLVDENGFATATTLTANDAFSYLFSDNENLKDISGLLLPATTLTESCYATMFFNCTGLTTVPSDLLPATTLASRCYVAMFGSCVNLTNVPTLPATTLAELCYNNMFRACTGLTTVPTDLLPATTLAPSCYSYMFLNCFNLTTAPALPATTLAEKCYQSMFANCTTLAASPVLPATTLAEKCYQRMFYDCENLATVPDTLPATTLASYCYQQMFYGCENLAASPVLPATTLVSYCYQQMFYDCSNLSSVTCLATSGINQNSSTEYWLDRAGDHVQGTKTVNAASSANWPMNNDNGIPSGWTLVTPPTPLTIEALTAGTIVVQQPKSGMQYTLNGGPKTAMTEAPTEITVAVGDKVAFYGNGTSITSYDGTGITGGTAEVKAYGNIMSLVNETGFATATTLTAHNAFYSLFEGYENLKDISGLKLPATTLTEGCYASMFSYCTGLTTVPSDLLPATTLARSCYRRMFGGCENLTNVPTLPATTLAMGCYDMMFSFCTGLATVPSDLLPATTLAEGCYSSMFLYCLNLTTAPVLPATTLAEGCYSSMFLNCLNLTTAPVLPATTLVGNCYQEMFYSCSKLSSVTCLATSGINQNSSTENWLESAGSDVQGTKTFNAASTANWPTDDVNGIPDGWTRQNIDN